MSIGIEEGGRLSVVNAPLELLRTDVAAWNEWRGEHPDLVIDLSHADLAGWDLRRANLYRIVLIETDLRGANLEEALLAESRIEAANLIGCNLSSTVMAHCNLLIVNMYNANLQNADLEATSMTATTLTNADLRAANLERAQFNLSKLEGAMFQNATMGLTLLGSLDLSRARGLEEVRHQAPSSLGIDTLILSGGNIPESFLRGVGLPDTIIDYAASLVNKPIDYYSCFITYSTKDQDFADRLYADLQANGVRCWLATEDLKIGDKMLDTIDQAIRDRDKVLIVLSEHSIGSEWVKVEVKKAMAEERQRRQTVLFPIRLDRAVMETNEAWAATIREDRHIGDFRTWKDHDGYQQAFTRLLRDLKAAE